MKINPLLFDHKGRMQLGSDYPTDVKWHPLYAEDELYHCIAASYSTGEIKLFHVEVDNDGAPKGLSVDHNFIPDEHSECNCLDWSPDGQYIAAGYKDGRLRLFNIWKNQQEKDFDGKGHTNYVESVSFSSDGKYIASGSFDLTVRLWEAKTGRSISGFYGKGHTNSVASVSFSPDGKYIVSGSWDHTVRLWEAKTGRSVSDFDGKGHTNSVHSVSFSPDGKYIVSGSGDHTVRLWACELILGPTWLKEHLATPLILASVWFPEDALDYLKETKQGSIVPNRPLARCGECGFFFPVEDNMLGKDIGCPNKIGKTKRCNRLVKLNEFTAGEER